jgi:tetratricopeptide (TPR) repeat protein
MHRARWLLAAVALAVVCGCGPSIEQIQRQGVAEFEAGRTEEALGIFEWAREKDPNRADTLYYIARCYVALAEQYRAEGDLPAAMSRIERALFFFDEAIEEFPGYSDALRAKNEALERRDSWESALAVAKWASRQAGPQAKHYLFLAREEEQRQDFDAARLAYLQAVRIEPDNPTAHAELGAFYLRAGDYGNARLHLFEAQVLNPAEPGVAEALARLQELSSSP